LESERAFVYAAYIDDIDMEEREVLERRGEED